MNAPIHTRLVGLLLVLAAMGPFTAALPRKWQTSLGHGIQLLTVKEREEGAARKALDACLHRCRWQNRRTCVGGDVTACAFEWSAQCDDSTRDEFAALLRHAPTLSLDDAHVRCVAVARGDETQIVHDTEGTGQDLIVGFLGEIWNRNDYGELVALDDVDNYTVVASVHHVHGRLMRLDDRVRFFVRPPSYAVRRLQVLMLAHPQPYALTPLVTSVDVPSTFQPLALDTLRVIQQAPHLARMAVVDGVFGEDAALAHQLMSAALWTSSRAQVNTADRDASSKAFALKTRLFEGTIAPENFVTMPLWREVLQRGVLTAVETLTGTRISDVRVTSITLQLGAHSDEPRIRSAGEADEQGGDDERFALVAFVTQGCATQDCGETAVYGSAEDTFTGTEWDPDALSLIKPFAGRLLVVPGHTALSHRAPIINFTGTRLSLEVRMAVQPTQSTKNTDIKERRKSKSNEEL